MNEYAIVVQWDAEDKIWVAEAPDVKTCSAHGATPEQAVSELRIAMAAWFDLAREEGLPIPVARFHIPADAAE